MRVHEFKFSSIKNKWSLALIGSEENKGKQQKSSLHVSQTRLSAQIYNVSAFLSKSARSKLDFKMQGQVWGRCQLTICCSAGLAGHGLWWRNSSDQQREFGCRRTAATNCGSQIQQRRALESCSGRANVSQPKNVQFPHLVVQQWGAVCAYSSAPADSAI
jgi:hypothetical protein